MHGGSWRICARANCSSAATSGCAATAGSPTRKPKRARARWPKRADARSLVHLVVDLGLDGQHFVDRLELPSLHGFDRRLVERAVRARDDLHFTDRAVRLDVEMHFHDTV